jgi:aldose 1-epimerase
MKIVKNLIKSIGNKDIFEITIENSKGVKLVFYNYGGIVKNFITPDKNGHPDDIVLGFDDLEGYFGEHPYFGALIGRFANRIAKGKFSLHGKEYTLAVNNFGNHLHGGIEGIDKKVWDVELIDLENEAGAQLLYISQDGEEGYPGNLKIEVKILLSENNELIFEYKGSSDKDTPVNLTHHGYFNLSGKEDILDHELKIHADKITPKDETGIPTGELLNVEGTAFDFNEFRPIGEFFPDDDGFDHNYVLKGENGGQKQAAILVDKLSGRKVEVYTTEPGMQLYTSAGLDGTITGKNGKSYQKFGAVCLETQNFPDAVNKPEFPSCIVGPGKSYYQKTTYKVGIE